MIDYPLVNSVLDVNPLSQLKFPIAEVESFNVFGVCGGGSSWTTVLVASLLSFFIGSPWLEQTPHLHQVLAQYLCAFPLVEVQSLQVLPGILLEY